MVASFSTRAKVVPIHTDWRKAKTLALLAEYKAHPSIALRNRIIELNTGLIRTVALRYVDRCPEGYEDLVQIGVTGMIKAIDRFDCERNAAFSSYAVPFVKGAIQHYLRDNWSHLKTPRRWVEFHEQVTKIKRRLAAKGRDISEERIALSFKCPPAQWREIQQANQRKPFACLEDVHNVESDEEVDEDIERGQLKQRLLTEVARLPETKRNCVMGKFFEGLDEATIARKQRITPEQVGLLIEQSMTTIRKRMESA